jgi:hypothetical protein
MHILDNDSDNPITGVTLDLTASEAGELRDKLTALLKDHPHGHDHVSDTTYQKETRAVVYAAVHCGPTCGKGMHTTWEKRNGQWVQAAPCCLKTASGSPEHLCCLTDTRR